METCERFLDGNGILGELASGTTDEPSPYNEEVVLQLLCAAARRRVFLTDKSYPELGPRTMRPGDEVHIIPGGRVPFVLRRDQEEKSEQSEQHSDENAAGTATHSMQGAAFMYGLINGEALTWEDLDWNERYIR